MNPYESDATRVHADDAYADVPLYGRYLPDASDFRVDRKYINSDSTAAQAYWRSVIKLCDESNRIYPADEGGRDVFALGSVIVKSSHLHPQGTNDSSPSIDYSYADENEVHATAVCKKSLGDIRVPEFYFNGEVDGRQTLVQERLPGVCLNVAAPYLSASQKVSFKTQARELIQQMRTIKPEKDLLQKRGHVVPDPNILTYTRLNPLESELLFADHEANPDLCLMHNDLTPSNIIVDNDRIVGLIDWEMAGYIGLVTAAEIHRKVRTPQREHFANVSLSEERLRDIMWWNNLYDGL